MCKMWIMKVVLTMQLQVAMSNIVALDVWPLKYKLTTIKNPAPYVQ